MPQPTQLKAPSINTAGTAVTTAGVAAEESVYNGVRKVKITLTSAAFTMTDNGANGSGSLKIWTCPEGLVTFLGTVANVTIAYAAVTDANVIGAVGTAAAAADATLTSTEANLVPSTASATTAGAGTFAGVSTSLAVIDGTTTAVPVYLNLATSTDPSTNNSITLTGTVEFNYIVAGDK